jgi:hypothetical protein
MSRALLVLAVLLSLPGVASAQGPSTASITSPVLASQPWSRGPAMPTANIVRDVWVAPETLVVARRVPLAQPRTGVTQYAVVEDTVVVPGYWMIETADRVYVPQRLALENVSPGVYRWRVLPAEVRAR